MYMTKEKELIILTRLQLNPEEEITRKEYLKRKKKYVRNYRSCLYLCLGGIGIGFGVGYHFVQQCFLSA